MQTYHFNQTYQWNYDNGPDFKGEFPVLEDKQNYELFGKKLNSPIGISAGILLNSNWVETYARLGYDILTYKTVRSSKRAAYDLPNWVFLDVDAPLEADYDHPLIANPEPTRPLERLTSAVCFGMPSADPKKWRDDVPKAKEAMKPGQMLMVSVVGTPNENCELKALAKDYALCAKWAAEAGADAIEVNLSCPNVNTEEGQIYQSNINTRRILEAIREEIPDDMPLAGKIGTFSGQPDYENFLVWTEPYLQGVVLVNCLSRRIHTPKGSPAFGKGHERAGVIGWGTYHQCYTQSKMIVDARNNANTSHKILSVGGVVMPSKANDYLKLGVDAVLLGGAPALDPFLGVKIKEELARKVS